jgi:hypothetical protein
MPIGRLFLIPTVLEGELFRQARKGRLVAAIVGPMVTALGLAGPLAEDIGREASDDGALFLTLLCTGILAGMIVPLAIFGLRYQRFLKTRFRRVHPVPDVALGFVCFGIVLAILVFCYKFFAGYLSASTSGPGQKGASVSESLGEIGENVVRGFLENPHSSIAALIITLFKAASGVVIVFFGTAFSLVGASTLVDTIDDAAFLVVLAVGVLSFVVSFRYLVTSERRRQGPVSRAMQIG